MGAWSRIKMASGILSSLAAACACVAATDSTSQSTNQSTNQSSQGGSSTTTEAATGISCSTDKDTGATLCIGTTSCPNVLVDTVQFPNCGFRTLKSSYELDCICFGSYLCPVGTVSSCQEVKTLFSGTTLSKVCNGVSLDYCKTGTASVAQGTGGATSKCDQTCYASCGGSLACIVDICGC